MIEDKNPIIKNNAPRSYIRKLMEILAVSAKLGLTSFGGPIAHLGYFHDEYVRRRQWLSDRSYADLVALCQFLPGPASSQVGIGIGAIRAGVLGGFAAWLGFTLPSVIALVLFAYLLQGFDFGSAGWIHGLKIVAVAIVAQAIAGMWGKLAQGRGRATIAIFAASATLLWPTVFGQVLIMVTAGIVGLILYRESAVSEEGSLNVPVKRSFAAVCLILFFGLLLLLPLIRQSAAAPDAATMFDSFYRAGSLVFGGGHVVLPMLEREVVPTGWIGMADFSAGYGAAQAVPGPLFTFAAYLGAMIGGAKGAAIATAAIFLPAFLLIMGTLPFWSLLRKNAKVQGALIGVNAAVVGILLAALYSPLGTTAILAPEDFALASLLFLMLVYWKLPPWIVVTAGAIGGMLIAFI